MHISNKILALLAIGFLMAGCNSNPNYDPDTALFTRLSSSETGVEFENRIRESQEFNLFTFRNFYNGGGVALADFNNDGLQDIYLTANQGSNKLYLNEGGMQFRDITESAGVSGIGSWSTGAAVADVNADGLPDIYLLQSGDIGGNNRRNELYINQGDLTFEEKAGEYGLAHNGYSVNAAFFDYDGDGDLDCYLLNNSFRGTNMERMYTVNREDPSALGGDVLFRNDGGTFTDVSREAGIYQGELGFGLGIAIGDVNMDHRPDIYVSNDFWERDYLYINRGDGTFSEELTERTTQVSQSSMGNDIADLNNDGLLDIFTTDMLPIDAERTKSMTVFDDYHYEDPKYHSSFHYQYVQNALQMNNGDGTFTEMGFLAGVAATDWSWAGLVFDFDNDGWNDIYVTNGVFRDITDLDFQNFLGDRQNIARIVRERGEFNIMDFLDRMPSEELKNFAYLNNRDKTFSHLSDTLGFIEPTFSNGAAYGDLDNDGDLDLVVNNLQKESYIYRNESDSRRSNRSLKVEFEGPDLNPFGVGAQVTAYREDLTQTAVNIPNRAFQSTVPPYLYFGLGSDASPDSLRVVWPDRRTQLLTDIKPEETLTVRYEDADVQASAREVMSSPILEQVAGEVIDGETEHRENDFIDFQKHPLLPRMLSREGPALAVGDVSGDNRQDLLVTGAAGNRDKLFLQREEGALSPFTGVDLDLDEDFEGTAAAMLDIDTDGSQDLVVANGGAQMSLTSDFNRIRTYRNNGEGLLEGRRGMAPDIKVNACCLEAEDYDGDGDRDLFVGSRSVPLMYGLNPKSYLLENKGDGNWEIDTPEELREIGMVTGAAWTDYNGDGSTDLVVVGEWMPVTLFRNSGGTLEFDREIAGSHGWWSSVTAADLDGDGDEDLVLGNWGLNSKFRASRERPIRLYVNDFDGNGNAEPIITTYMPGEEHAYPFARYKDLIRALPFLKDRIPSHQAYAGKQYVDIFTYQERQGAVEKEVYTLESSLLINNSGKFEQKALPIEAQLAPVFATIVDDFNGDRLPDLLLLGNQHGLKPEVGRIAANNGVFLINQGEADFRYLPYRESGVMIRGEVRDAGTIMLDGEKHYVIARNNDELLLYRQSD